MIIEAGTISTLRHLCEWPNPGVPPSSPISVGSIGGGLSSRGMSPGGRNWSSTTGMSIGGSDSLSHAHWGGSSHVLPHYSYGGFHHHHAHVHAHSSIYQPHSAAMEDDK